jgi:hypothetical protein
MVEPAVSVFALMTNLTIVTAADSTYYTRVQSLLWSIALLASDARVILVDLGLTQEQSDYLNNTPPFYIRDFLIQKFDFSKYPAYFNITKDSGRVGFRSVSVQAAARQYGGIVLWLDAKMIVQSGIGGLIAEVLKHGIHCPITMGTVDQTVFPSAQTALGVTPEIARLWMRRMGVCGFDTSKPAVMSFIDQWAATSLDAKCAAPEGSSKATHYDGGVFAVLLAKFGITSSIQPVYCVEVFNYGIQEARFRLRHLINRVHPRLESP